MSNAISVQELQNTNTRDELRDIARENDLKVGGTKAELAERIWKDNREKQRTRKEAEELDEIDLREPAPAVVYQVQNAYDELVEVAREEAATDSTASSRIVEALEGRFEDIELQGWALSVGDPEELDQACNLTEIMTRNQLLGLPKSKGWKSGGIERLSKAVEAVRSSDSPVGSLDGFDW